MQGSEEDGISIPEEILEFLKHALKVDPGTAQCIDVAPPPMEYTTVWQGQKQVLIPRREVKAKPNPREVDLTKGISIPKLTDADKEVLMEKAEWAERAEKNGNSGAT